MGNTIESAIFRVPTSKYRKTMKYLTFLNRKELSYSYNIPVTHLHINDDYPTLLICHGIGENLGYYDLDKMTNQYNCNICIFDYAGYGLHTCKYPSESECRKDVMTVYNYLINNKNIEPEKIVIYGRSLGTVVACYLAYHIRNDTQQPKKLILVSPLSSAYKVVTNIWLPGDLLINYTLAPDIKCSTFILHGCHDTVIPHSCGQELSTKFPNLYKFHTLHGRGHNNIFTTEYYTVIN